MISEHVLSNKGDGWKIDNKNKKIWISSFDWCVRKYTVDILTVIKTYNQKNSIEMNNQQIWQYLNTIPTILFQQVKLCVLRV